MGQKNNSIFFAKNCKFSQVELDNQGKLAEQFKNRVETYYLTPAENLNQADDAFAAGIMCVATIDLLVTVEKGDFTTGENKRRFLGYLKSKFNFTDHNAEHFYEDFRCGIVHNGIIKNNGLFSYDYEDLIKTVIIERESIIIVNPKKLIEKLCRVFNEYITRVKNDENTYRKLKGYLEDKLSFELYRKYEEKLKREA